MRDRPYAQRSLTTFLDFLNGRVYTTIAMNQPTNQPVIDGTPAVADEAQSKKLGSLKIPTSALRAYTMVLALIVVWLLFTWATDGIFLEARNFSNLMRQTAVTGVLAVGMLMVIVTGQIDLSVGSVVGLTGGVAAMLLTWLGWGLVPSLAAAVVVGAVIGLAQGTLVAYANVPAFIVTLGGLLIWRGIIKGVSKGSTIPVELRSFKFIGQGYVAPFAGIAIAVVAVAAIVLINVRRIRSRSRHGLAAKSVTSTIFRIVIPSVVIVGFILALNSYAGVPIPVIILLAVAMGGAFLTQNTTFGRYLYAIGSNRDAARLSGIRVRRHILVVFCIMGALAGVSGSFTPRGSAAARPMPVSYLNSTRLRLA